MKKILMVSLALLIYANGFADMASSDNKPPCCGSASAHFIASGAFFVISIAEFIQSNDFSQKTGENLKTANENLSLYDSTGSRTYYDRYVTAQNNYSDYLHSKELSFGLGVVSIGVSAYLFARGYSIREQQKSKKNPKSLTFDIRPAYTGVAYRQCF